MKVLALTHAQLNQDGLSPVSCERADSIVGSWAGQLGWDVDVIHTKNSKWPGIWPEGKGLNVNIISEAAPESLMMGNPQLFSTTMKHMLAKKQVGGAVGLITGRIRKRLRASLSAKGFAYPHELSVAKKWGLYLSGLPALNKKPYDFIFACIGYGDEYLLETTYTLSRRLHIPMVVDYRDLWSEHHEPHRFTDKQRAQIMHFEKKLLSTTALISVPQKHMTTLLEKWVKCPVYLLSHSAYVDKSWEDGKVVSDEFRLLYAGKLYAGSPGLDMLLQTIKALAQEQLYKPVKARFFVDDVARLKAMAADMGITDHIDAHGWVPQAEIWKEMRSAHVLITFDSGIMLTMPLLMTKVFQYAYSGRPIVALYKYDNPAYDDFYAEYKAGSIFYNIPEAVAHLKNAAADKQAYEIMPTFRKVPMRGEAGAEYGKQIAAVLKKDK